MDKTRNYEFDLYIREHGYTVVAISKMLNMHPSAISAYRTGRTPISIKTAKVINQKLGCNVITITTITPEDVVGFLTENNLNSDELADLTGLGKSTIYRFVQRLSTPTDSTIDILTDFISKYGDKNVGNENTENVGLEVENACVDTEGENEMLVESDVKQLTFAELYEWVKKHNLEDAIININGGVVIGKVATIRDDDSVVITLKVG